VTERRQASGALLEETPRRGSGRQGSRVEKRGVVLKKRKRKKKNTNGGGEGE